MAYELFENNKSFKNMNLEFNEKQIQNQHLKFYQIMQEINIVNCRFLDDFKKYRHSTYLLTSS